MLLSRFTIEFHGDGDMADAFCDALDEVGVEDKLQAAASRISEDVSINLGLDEGGVTTKVDMG